jgi:dTDP-4-dehydrorhamnose reductase
VDAAEDDADAAFAVNAEGAGHVARSAARLGVPCLHVSTDYVFDGRSDEAYTPSDPVRPLGVYGRSKEAGERAVRAAGPNHLILRTAWVYSPFGHNFVRTMLRVGAERDELTVVDDQIGNPTAAHAIAEALLTASSAMTRSPDPALRGTFHFTGRGSVSWCGFARAIFRQAQAEGCSAAPTVTAITSDQWPTRAPRPGNSRLDSSAFQVAFGYEAKPWPEDLATVLAQLSDDMGTAGRRRQ